VISRDTEGLFWRLVASNIRDMRLDLSRQFADGKERLGRSGLSVGTGVQRTLTEIARSSLRQHVEKGWEVLQRVLSEVGLTADAETADSLKIVMGRFIAQNHQEIAKDLEKALNQELHAFVTIELEQEAIAQRERIDAEIDLLIQRLRNQRAPAPAQPVFNFHAAVGAVQTGAGATAHVTQSFGGPALETLGVALEQLATAIAAAHELNTEARAELQAVVTDTRDELRASTPNRLKVTALAQGFATSIQSIASLSPAYSAVKAAFAAFGVYLP